MIRLAISVEGETEETFVKRVLSCRLRIHGIEPFPILPRRRGGNISVDRLAPAMADLVWSFDAVTSLVDFYGFRGKGSATPSDLEKRIDAEIAKRIGRPYDESSVFSYVQRHEFESLLFSNVKVFASLLHAPPNIDSTLQEIRDQFDSPEDINDHVETAPSKRIKQALHRYNKRNDGADLATLMGLDVIRGECPRFDQWLHRLECLPTDLERSQ